MHLIYINNKVKMQNYTQILRVFLIKFLINLKIKLASMHHNILLA